MGEQVDPASGTRVAGGNRRRRQRPRYCKIRVVVGDGQIFGWVVRSIDSIAHIGARGKRLKAMQETGRHIQMPKIAVVEKKSLMLAEGRRVLSNVDQHIVDGTVGASHQLRFASARARVHAADGSPLGAGLGVLDERSGAPGRAEMVVENIGVESPCEQASLIAERLWDKDENIGEGSPLNTHLEMLP